METWAGQAWRCVNLDKRGRAEARTAGGVASLLDPVFGGMAGIAVASAAWIALGTAPDTASWLAQTVLNGIFVWLSWRIATNTAYTATARRFWRAAAAGGFVFTAGSLVRAVDSINQVQLTTTRGVAPSVLMTAGSAWLLIVMLAHPPDVNVQGRLRLWLDAAIVMIAASVVVWAVAVTGGSSGTRPGQLVGTVIGAAIMLAAAFAVIRLLLTGDAPFSVPAGVVAGAAITLFGVEHALNSVIAESANVRAIFILRLVPPLLLAAAPRIEQLIPRTPSGDLATRERERPGRLLFAAVVVVDILLLVQLLREGLTARTWGSIIGIIAITALALVRQNLALMENVRLVRKLDKSMQRLTNQERLFRSMVQHASDITMLVNGNFVVTYVTPAIEPILGHTPSSVVGRSILDVVGPEGREEVESLLGGLIKQRSGGATARLQVRHHDGPPRWLFVTATALMDDPAVSALVINIRDITESVEFQDRLQYEATHDSLTGLANRALLNERAERVAEDPRHRDRSKAAVMLDLDKFKAINDTLGHHAGDELLQAVADRLRHCVRPTDTVARLGGDEFGVLLLDTSRADATDIARRMLETLAKPIDLHGHPHSAPASIGVAVDATQPFETLLRDADSAMYRAKRDGSGLHVFDDVDRPTAGETSGWKPHRRGR